MENVGSFWNDRNIGGKDIATILFNLTKGNKFVLESDFSPSTSVWGKALHGILQKTSSSLSERLAIFKVWYLSELDVEVNFDNLVQEKVNEESLLGFTVKEKENSRFHLPCSCEFKYVVDASSKRLQCTSCKRKCHVKCSNFDADFKPTDKIKCKNCKGPNPKQVTFDDGESLEVILSVGNYDEDLQTDSDEDAPDANDSASDIEITSPAKNCTGEIQRDDKSPERDVMENESQNIFPTDYAENDEELPVDTSSIPRSFSFEMDAKTLLTHIDAIKACQGTDTRYIIWTKPFKDSFGQHNKQCTINITKKVLWEKEGDAFLKAYAGCTRKKSKTQKCTSNWIFTVKNKPENDEKAKVDVIMVSGELLHFASEKKTQNTMGPLSKRAKLELATEQPLSIRTKQLARADKEKLNSGNFSEVNSLNALRKRKQRIEAAQDKDKNAIDDLCIEKVDQNEKFEDGEFPGYIQNVTPSPFSVQLFSVRQMAILKKLHAHKEGKMIQLDATGGIIGSLPPPYDTRPPLLYTMIIRCPGKEPGHMPVSEFITCNNTYINVMLWLLNFFESYRKRFSITSKAYGVDHIETDFSSVMMTASATVFASMKLEDYINILWKKANEPEENEQKFVCLHVCRFHILRAIRGKMEECYPERKGKAERDSQDDLLETWLLTIVRIRTMAEFHRRLKEIAILTGFRLLRNCVEKVLSNFHDEPENNEWQPKSYQQPEPKASFYKRTYFGIHAAKVFDSIAEQNKTHFDANKDKGYPENPFYSPAFSHYLKVYIFPFFPLISHLTFALCKVDLTMDTNNYIENYHGILKNNYYKNRKNQKIGRFVRRQSVFIEGVCTSAEVSYNIRRRQSVNVAPTRSDSQTRETGHQVSETPCSSNSQSQGTPIQMEEVPCCSSTLSQIEKSNVLETPRSSKLSRKGRRSFTSKSFSQGTRKQAKSQSREKSPESCVEVFKKSQRNRSLSQPVSTCFTTLVPLIPAGGRVANDYGIIDLRNTYCFDSILNVLAAVKLTVPGFETFLHASFDGNENLKSVMSVINNIIQSNFATAKQQWLKEIMPIDIIGRAGDCHADEMVHASTLAHWFPIRRKMSCLNPKCMSLTKTSQAQGVLTRGIDMIYEASPSQFINVVNNGYVGDAKCLCGTKKKIEYDFLFSNEPFLFYIISFSGSDHATATDLPPLHVLKGKRYKVFAYTCFVKPENDTSSPYYVAKFLWNKKTIVYDTFSGKKYTEKAEPKNHLLSTVWLIPEEK